MGHELIVVGVTHRSAPVELRERLALSNGQIGGLIGSVVASPGIDECVVLSTCNRVEVVACGTGGLNARHLLSQRLLEAGGLDADRDGGCLVDMNGRDAVRHVFRVASSLDSMVVGEPQILGQLKEQFALSVKAAAAGPILHRVFERAFSVAKRVRTETGIAARAVSVASAAVELAGKIFETLNGRTVMLIGAGETGGVAARHLVAAGAGRLLVTNRSFDAAVELAREIDGTPVPFERFQTYLPLADLVVGCAGGGEVLAAEAVLPAMTERNGEPVFFIDLAVPRNFAAALNALDNVYLYDIDDLAEVADENLEERYREAVEGEVIVEEEVESFWRWLEALDVEPTIVELRDLAEGIRSEETERTLRRIPGMDEAGRDSVERMTRAIVNKLLHLPTAVLKEDASSRAPGDLVAAVRRLFGLGSHK